MLFWNQCSHQVCHPWDLHLGMQKTHAVTFNSDYAETCMQKGDHCLRDEKLDLM